MSGTYSLTDIAMTLPPYGRNEAPKGMPCQSAYRQKWEYIHALRRARYSWRAIAMIMDVSTWSMMRTARLMRRRGIATYRPKAGVVPAQCED